jgi:hypothetical protein
MAIPGGKPKNPGGPVGDPNPKFGDKSAPSKVPKLPRLSIDAERPRSGDVALPGDSAPKKDPKADMDRAAVGVGITEAWLVGAGIGEGGEE